MEVMDFEMEKKRERAKKQVAELKGFYVHLLVYILVNQKLSKISAMANNARLIRRFTTPMKLTALPAWPLTWLALATSACILQKNAM